MLSCIRFYQVKLTPYRKNKGCCKYYPTCSNYAYQAIQKYGSIKGGALAFWRLLRCNPFSRGGYDPVP